MARFAKPRFFIMEQVVGHDAVSREEEKDVDEEASSSYMKWLCDLQERAPFFAIAKWRLDAREFGLPQHRSRLYTIGVRREYLRLPPPRPAPLPLERPENLWQKFLHPGLPKTREEFLTPQQWSNLQIALRDILATGAWTNPICISVDRNPAKKFGAMSRRDGYCSTLRTGNELLWLAWLDDSGDRSFSRPLHPIERFAVQGLNPWFCKFLSKKNALLASGNAMALPVVASVFQRIINAFALKGVLVSRPGRPLAEGEESERQQKRVRLQLLREQLALFEGAARPV